MAHFEDTTMAPSQELPPFVPCVTFASELPNALKEHRIGPLIDERQLQRRLYYGIEILPRTENHPVCLNFSRFLPVLPLFVSVAWLGRSSWFVEPVGQVESLQLAKHLAPRIPVMPHLTLYRLSEERLDQFLDLKFRNVLALRGDEIYPSQSFRYSKDIVVKAKARSKDKMSVCVGGFPEGYNRPKGMPPNITLHLKFLKEKVDAGADCIITQVCYQHETIIDYVKKVREAGITVPILIGITTYETYKKYKTIERLQGARLKPQLYKKLVKMNNEFLEDPRKNPYQIREFFIELYIHLICQILKSKIEVFGFQIFTLNNLGATAALLQELHKQHLFDEKLPEVCKPLDSNLMDSDSSRKRTGLKRHSNLRLNHYYGKG
ncbi:methylenetetrahydrofolate reductase-like [Drosophila serrata]|uniref:methylenetetrahydrofolate reductase-like n=1 Tax=Drosophila serrata TaxID=7274 RepID=UPI000A1D1EF2|nr:methylenetetrahydrofolate reductase-like [Drosophila serrata]